MVTAVASFGRSGLYDWLVQRFSAVILAFYTIFLVAYVGFTANLDYDAWSSLYSQTWMRVFTLLAIVAVIAHAWIGLWAVLTDYITDRMMGSPALAIRMIIMAIFVVVAFASVVWGVDILWGF